MDIHKFTRLLGRYRKGNANETEKALADAWYRTYQPEESGISLSDTEKERIHGAMANRLRQAYTVKTNKTQRRLFYRMAAGFLLLALAGASYYAFHQYTGNNYTTITTTTGRLERVVLPDSSVAWLNAASRLRIQSAFDQPLREVFLDEGEAFFEVKKNPAQPFVVHTASLDIRVLGTSFNVRSYKEAPEIKVSVSTGRVAVNQRNRQLAVLTSDQQLKYNRQTGAYSQLTVDAGNERAWREGNIYLRQATFNELALTFKNTYGMLLHAGTPEIQNYRFTLRLNSSLPVDEAMNLIQAIHNTNYRKEGNTITLY